MKLTNELQNLTLSSISSLPDSVRTGTEWQIFVISDKILVSSPDSNGIRNVSFDIAFDVPAGFRIPSAGDIVGGYDKTICTVEIVLPVYTTPNPITIRKVEIMAISFNISSVGASDIVKYLRFGVVDSTGEKKKKVVSTDPDSYPVFGEC